VNPHKFAKREEDFDSLAKIDPWVLHAILNDQKIAVPSCANLGNAENITVKIGDTTYILTADNTNNIYKAYDAIFNRELCDAKLTSVQRVFDFAIQDMRLPAVRQLLEQQGLDYNGLLYVTKNGAAILESNDIDMIYQRCCIVDSDPYVERENLNLPTRIAEVKNAMIDGVIKDGVSISQFHIVCNEMHKQSKRMFLELFSSLQENEFKQHYCVGLIDPITNRRFEAKDFCDREITQLSIFMAYAKMLQLALETDAKLDDNL
jgi:hypothetical protein